MIIKPLRDPPSKWLTQLMIPVRDADSLKDRREVSKMFKRLVPQNQNRRFCGHSATLSPVRVKHFGRIRR